MMLFDSVRYKSAGGPCTITGGAVVRLSILITCSLVASSSLAFAQTKGRVSVGASVTLNATTDSDVATAVTGGPRPARSSGTAGRPTPWS
jgi:hypothetical protein